MPLKIRPAHPGDADALTDILHRSKGSWNYDQARMDGFRCNYRITSKDFCNYDIVVAEEQGQPRGFAAGRPENDFYRIEYLFIAPEAFGRGLGRLLLARMTDFAHISERKALRLESDYYAEDFYKKHGFKVIGDFPSPMAPTGRIPTLELALPPLVQPLSEITLKVARDKDWTFERENRRAIDDHWMAERKRNPHLWNGRALKLTDFTYQDGIFNGTCTECDFASALAWRDWGYPDLNARNLFGSAIIKTTDNALLYGIMAPHTANPGKIYPPGGGLDLSDLSSEDDSIDVLGSTYRELEEETGLSPAEVTLVDRMVVFDGPKISVGGVFQTEEEAAPLRDRILKFSQESEEQELADMLIIRSEDDLKLPAIPPFARAIARRVLNLP